MPESEVAPAPPSPSDALAALRDHVRSAQQAAERLASETGPARPRAGSTASTPGDNEAGARADAEWRSSTHATSDAGADREQQQTPPSGWAAGAAGEDPRGELRALVELLEALRTLLPDELREQLNDLVRQVLLLTRAVIDWLVVRLESESQPPTGEKAIQDIPIS